MHTTNLRDLYNLHWSKVILGILLFLCFSVQEALSQGQGYRRKHLEHYDDKPIHYGILFAVPFTRYAIRHNEDFMAKDSAFLIQSPTKAAFRMGFTVNAYLNERFDLRTTPSVSLYDRQVKYSYPSGAERSEKRESTWIEIPLLLKYKSQRRVNTRMYMVAGMTMAIETNVGSRRASKAGTLNTKSSDFTIDYGIGYEQFFEFFKFAPELRFSHGIGNIFHTSPTSLGKGIGSLRTHTVTLYLNFE
jgi:hypothetical protein